jgi:alkylation response protein AidB-like acyl-CoA dehydrogenase
MFFNEDHDDIRALAKEFAEKKLAPIANDIDHNDEVPQEIYDEMAEMGFYGLKIPEEYGGLGLDTRSYVCVMEEICKKSITCSLTFSSANSLSTAPLLLAGTEQQKQKYVPGIASGEEFMAFGLTEPGAGSDAGAMTTKAVEDGDYYILNGRKTFITGAPFAKNCVVFAKTNPDKGPKGITSFIVDMSLPGVSVGKHEEKMGLRGVATSDVVLEDVRVHKSEILGEIDRGFITAMKTLSIGRIGVSCQGIGVAQGAMEEAVKHIKERKQFGQYLADFQALRFMVAEMETKINAAKLLVYNAAYKMDMGEDVTKDSSMAKYFATEMALEVVSNALQLHGGYGYSKEYPIERMYRDARVLTIFEGTTQVQQMVIAGQVLSK